MRDLSEKLQAMEEPGDYRLVMELPGARDIQAAIRCAEDAGAPCLWQVVTNHTATYFRTMREATDYCRQRGWL